jgi:hypothetical protein
VQRREAYHIATKVVFMSYIQCIGTVGIALTLAGATLAGDKRALPAGGEKAAPRVQRIGAVAYAPSVVTVFENQKSSCGLTTWWRRAFPAVSIDIEE